MYCFLAVILLYRRLMMFIKLDYGLVISIPKIIHNIPDNNNETKGKTTKITTPFVVFDRLVLSLDIDINKRTM